MAVVTKSDQGSDSAGEADPAVGRDQPRAASPSVSGQNARLPGGPAGADKAPGWFSIYKSGQGYWTRMGTVAALALIVLLSANFGFTYLKLAFAGFADTRKLAIGLDVWLSMSIIAICVLVVGVLVFRVMNKPTVADFMIATESEMKKVNWTTKKDLIGSTKVVIGFVFILAALLFVIDWVFMTFFSVIGV